MVSAGLVQTAQLGQLPPDQAAGVIAAAVGRIRLGQPGAQITFHVGRVGGFGVAAVNEQKFLIERWGKIFYNNVKTKTSIFQ